MIGVKPLFSGRSLGEGENADFDVVLVGAGRQAAGAQSACATSCSRSRPAISGTASDGSWDYEPVKSTSRVADGQLDVAADTPGAHLAAGATGAAIASKCPTAERTAR